ncbi:MAG: ABC transporter ATP-binding protein [Candidatus Rokuibacteriota bacterium]
MRKTYGVGDAAQTALHDVDFALEAGDFAILSGPSGSGKTTLLNLLGLLDRPERGQVLIDGAETGALTEAQRADLRNRKIGFVFQWSDLVPVLTAEQNVTLPLEIRGVRRRQAVARALEMLDRVGLSTYRSRQPGQLSAGQCQRVSVARALVTDPAFVLADEPTANLDTANALHVVGLLRALRDHHGVTVLIATHDERLAERATRRIALLDGRIVLDERAAA